MIRHPKLGPYCRPKESKEEDNLFIIVNEQSVYFFDSNFKMLDNLNRNFGCLIQGRDFNFQKKRAIINCAGSSEIQFYEILENGPLKKLTSAKSNLTWIDHIKFDPVTENVVVATKTNVFLCDPKIQECVDFLGNEEEHKIIDIAVNAKDHNIVIEMEQDKFPKHIFRFYDPLGKLLGEHKFVAKPLKWWISQTKSELIISMGADLRQVSSIYFKTTFYFLKLTNQTLTLRNAVSTSITCIPVRTITLSSSVLILFDALVRILRRRKVKLHKSSFAIELR